MFQNSIDKINLLCLSCHSSLMLKGVEPQSTCELEVDAVAADILNQLDIEGEVLITFRINTSEQQLYCLLFVRLSSVNPDFSVNNLLISTFLRFVRR